MNDDNNSFSKLLVAMLGNKKARIQYCCSGFTVAIKTVYKIDFLIEL